MEGVVNNDDDDTMLLFSARIAYKSKLRTKHEETSGDHDIADESDDNNTVRHKKQGQRMTTAMTRATNRLTKKQ